MPMNRVNALSFLAPVEGVLPDGASGRGIREHASPVAFLVRASLRRHERTYASQSPIPAYPAYVWLGSAGMSFGMGAPFGSGFQFETAREGAGLFERPISRKKCAIVPEPSHSPIRAVHVRADPPQGRSLRRACPSRNSPARVGKGPLPLAARQAGSATQR